MTVETSYQQHSANEYLLNCNVSLSAKDEEDNHLIKQPTNISLEWIHITSENITSVINKTTTSELRESFEVQITTNKSKVIYQCNATYLNYSTSDIINMPYQDDDKITSNTGSGADNIPTSRSNSTDTDFSVPKTTLTSITLPLTPTGSYITPSLSGSTSTTNATSYFSTITSEISTTGKKDFLIIPPKSVITLLLPQHSNVCPFHFYQCCDSQYYSPSSI